MGRGDEDGGEVDRFAVFEREWSRTSPTISPIVWVVSGCSDSAAANGIRPDPQTGGSSVMGTTVNGPSPSRQMLVPTPYSANSVGSHQSVGELPGLDVERRHVASDSLAVAS